jgi:hypothetical protein
MKEEIFEQGAIPDDLKEHPKSYSTSTNFVLILNLLHNQLLKIFVFACVHLSTAEEELLPILIKYVFNNILRERERERERENLRIA